jgi:uncharacterized protein YqgC (DUF456 family)
VPSWLHVTVFWLTLIFMLVGLAGLIIPVFPGVVVIWLAALGYGIVTGFNTAGMVLFGLISVAMLVGVTVDNVLMGAGARQGGASWLSILVGLLAGVIGTLAFPPLGGILAAPVAVFLLEFGRGRDWRQAWLATRGLAMGWGLSFLARFGLGLLMIGLWLAWTAWR